MFKPLFAYLCVLFIFCLACSSSDSKATAPETKIDPAPTLLDTANIQISAAILKDLSTLVGKNAQAFKKEVYSYDKAGNESKYILDSGLIFPFVKEQIAHDAFEKMFAEIALEDNYLFLTNLSFDDDYNTYYDMIIAPEAKPFKWVKKIGTHGINYDLYNDDIIKQLKQWDEEAGLIIDVIDGDRVHAYLKEIPGSVDSFTQAVFEFCPDVIHQGYGDMDAMKADYSANQYLWLWWD